MSPAFTQWSDTMGPERPAVPRSTKPLSESEGEVDLSGLSEDELRAYHCQKRRLSQLPQPGHVTKEAEAQLAIDADEANASRLYTYYCRILGCQAVCSLRVEDKRIIMVRDERDQCELDSRLLAAQDDIILDQELPPGTHPDIIT